MKKGMKWMAACCIIPIVLVLALNFFGVGRSFGWLPALICPLMMIGMMWAMRGSGHSHDCCAKHEERSVEPNS